MRIPGKRGILFVGHDAARAGAQIELLHFLRWFKRNGDRPFSILLDGGGELLADYEQLAVTWSIQRSPWHPDWIRARVLGAVGLGEWAHRAEASDTRRFAARHAPALVYANSIGSARAIEVLAPRVPVLTHVHELDFIFRTQPEAALSRLLAGTRQFIACSNAVRENLLRNHALPAAKIETVHESIPVSEIRPDRTRQQVLQELRAADDAWVVIGGGSHNWRKGADLFVQLARLVCSRCSRAYFVWLGGAGEALQLEHDIRLAGLASRVAITGLVSKTANYLAAADVFALTSREDPYPLICLEAAALGKPIVSFADAGGIPEFVEDDCGFVVPYLDIMAMADRVISLLDSPDCRLKMGQAARRKVAERHDINAAGPRIMEIIERTIAEGGVRA